MDAIRWLYGLQHLGIKLGLDTTRGLLRLLGDPQRSYASVLVGGTNGKGSVAAMVQSILLAAGVRAGLYTSPHLVRPAERIRLGLGDMPMEELERRLGRVREHIAAALTAGELAAHPSFFEVITVVALEAFRDHDLSAAVLEVGMGGRLDATNAVDADVSVVVGIDLDHTQSLGPTLVSIAAEKAGIIKSGRPLVTGVVRQQPLDVLARSCRERGATWIDARLAVRLVEERADGALTFETARGRYSPVRLALAGRHQIDNARIAVAAVEAFAPRLGIEIDHGAVEAGLAGVRWPGRLEWLPRTSDRPALLLDGAHNPAGMSALATALRTRKGPRPVALFGAMEDKASESMLALLAPSIERLILTRPSVKRAADPATLVRSAGLPPASVEALPVPAEALARALELAGGDDERFVLVTGSLYLVGEVLGLLAGQPVPGPVSS